MPTSEILTIGTEILLGEIVDTNAPFIARALRDAGVDLHRKVTVGDNAARIAAAIQDAMARSEIIITTGGLGPTVDDPTRDAVALALGVETIFCQELWEQIQERFRRFNREPTENNKRQAYLPTGATAIENPVGTAPAFYYDTGSCVIFSLPGVPREMEHLLEHAVLPYLRKRFNLKEVILSRLLHTAGVGESQVDDLIGDLEALSNPTVGMAARAGQVDVRITAKAESIEKAAAMIKEVEDEIQRRLGGWIYGIDQETLEQAALNTAGGLGWKTGVLETGLQGNLARRLESTESLFSVGETFTTPPTPAALVELTRDFRQAKGLDAALGAVLRPSGDKFDLQIALITPLGERELALSYGGHPSYAPDWAVNTCLNLLRKMGPKN
jgi:nicotinamide-nucleotide amidase